MKRALVSALGALVLALARAAVAGPPTPVEPTRLVLDVRMAESAPGVPVRDVTWLETQVAEANRLMAGADVNFTVRPGPPLPDRLARMETRADRDALAALARDGALRVYVVASLRDVDEPDRMRQGVHWRRRANRAQRCVILSASAGPTVLAHELGHFFGNPHTQVVDNVMSYEREDPAKMAFDATQLGRIRRGARAAARSR